MRLEMENFQARHFYVKNFGIIKKVPIFATYFASFGCE